METDLDEQLADGDPAGRRASPAVRAALGQLVDDTRRASQRRRRRIAGAGAAALTVAVLGGAGAAAAAGALGWDGRGWWDDPAATTHEVTSASGQDCRLTYAPRALHVPDHPVSDEDRAAATTAATRFLRRFDHTTLEGLGPDQAFEEINFRLTRALAHEGLSTYAVGVALATDCDSGADR